ncbi:chaplin [Streptomyces sp. MST-110588]|uniref:chaplin n=1 Tax=Streptomyces sp. MST-110588 TaxID=2833628 RepID=UPI001F5D2EE4|nr:chaplin [Streptomyces sp. MST-110588]UNO42945.1 chaplin [Streptomyces sp. MST-110588]
MRIRSVIAATALVAAGFAGTAGTAVADTGPNGVAANSPGLLSGNTIQVPIHIPVEVCGNTIDIIALLNPTSGNVCKQKS